MKGLKLGTDNFSIRNFEASDSADVMHWWKERGWPERAIDQVSNQGYVVMKGNKKICAGWLFVCNGPWAWLEFIVSNPDASLRERALGLEMLVKFGLEVAKSAGYNIVTANLSSKGLIKLFEKCGFSKGDVGVTNMIARVN